MYRYYVLFNWYRLLFLFFYLLTEGFNSERSYHKIETSKNIIYGI